MLRLVLLGGVHLGHGLLGLLLLLIGAEVGLGAQYARFERL